MKKSNSLWTAAQSVWQSEPNQDQQFLDWRPGGQKYEWKIASKEANVHVCKIVIGFLGIESVLTIDNLVRSGVPVLKGTRFPLARVFAEFANDANISGLVDEFDLDPEVLLELLKNLALTFDRPFN